MQFVEGRMNTYSRVLVAVMLALLLGAVMLIAHPGSAMAAGATPATELTVNINDGGTITTVHTYTLDEINALSVSQAVYYSSIDSMPAPVVTMAKGVTLNQLVADINAKYNANVTIGANTLESIKVYATDNYSSSYTYDYLYGATRYYYPSLVGTWDSANNKPGVGANANPAAVDPMLALSSYQKRNLTNLDPSQMDNANTFRFCFGLTANDVVNNTITNNKFGKYVNKIEIIKKSNASTSLSIKVNNGNPITVTAAQIDALNLNNTIRHYSYAKDNQMNYYTGLGASLAEILSKYASVNSSDIQIMTVKAGDYYRTFEDPQNELFSTRYYYPAVGDKAAVDTIIATAAAEVATDDAAKLDHAHTMRLMMGQSAIDERTNSWMVKWVNAIEITAASSSDKPSYAVVPADNAAYSIGQTADGIKTMTVNSGQAGFKYFDVAISTVAAHKGTETVVFAHWRNGVETELNATVADFDVVKNAKAGFNVLSGDIIKVYVVDNLSNAAESNPVLLQ